MHYLYYTAVKKDKEITTPEKAKAKAESVLIDNNFSGGEGYWGGSKSDWFVMGGRWSGYLQEIGIKGWREKAKALIAKDKPKGEKEWISTEDTEKHAKELQALWEKMGGKGINPWGRDQYRHGGCDDDCQLLTKKLHTALLTTTKKNKQDDMWGETEVAIISDGYVEEETTLKHFLKMKGIIGNYYLAVVDYHN